MTRLVLSPLGVLLIIGLTAVSPTSGHALAAQALDSTGMPSLELLAMEAGRASRRHPIRAVAHAMLCEPGHPLVDSASLAACVTLDSARAVAIPAAFARGLEVPLAGRADGDTTATLPVCPTDFDRGSGPRVLIARITVPLVGVYEGRWEGRFTIELRCRSPDGVVRTLGKEYLYQWSGRAWQMYQYSSWRDVR